MKMWKIKVNKDIDIKNWISKIAWQNIDEGSMLKKCLPDLFCLFE
jgi:hypothetical protein